MNPTTKLFKVTIRHHLWPGRSETFFFHDQDASQRFMKFWIGIGGDADFEHVLHLPPPEPWPGPPPVADGGPAFGMSLRDYFAAKAMPKAAQDLVNAALLSGQTVLQRIAFNAYRMADEMIRARDSE